MSTISNIVQVPYIGTHWTCRVAESSATNPRTRIVSIVVDGVWVDAAVVLDSLFLNRLESAMADMPSNTDRA